MDGKEKVLKEFDFYSDQKKHWKIYYGFECNQGQLVASTEVLPEGIDKALSRKNLIDRLEMLPMGDYLIQFKPTADATKNIINCRFTIGYTDSVNKQQQNNNQTPAMRGYIDPETHDKLLKAESARINSEWQTKTALGKMNDALAEIKELHRNPPKSNMVNDIKDIMAMVKGMMSEEPVNTKPAVMNGPKAPVETNERRLYFKKLYDQAISELFRSEGEGEVGSESGIILLWCLNEWRKANPVQYKAMRPEILKLAKNLEDAGSGQNEE